MDVSATQALIRPGRTITGMAAVLLPFTSTGDVDWSGFTGQLERIWRAGLTPAVNMDTGYVNLLDDATKTQVLQRAKAVAAGRKFVAGAFVSDTPGAPFAEATYLRKMEAIRAHGGIPFIFQSFGLTGHGDEATVGSYETLGQKGGEFYGFELGTMFAPFGKVYSLLVYVQLLANSHCLGAKHSSLNREQEWQRISLRDRIRPDFQILTGNDLAIDMVMYGSDYLLGLAAFAPDYFAQRDAYWKQGDGRFYELNDALQYLGNFAFRSPVPAYKHSAAMFLHLRKQIASDKTHPQSPTRPESDREILQGMLNRLDALA